MSSSVNHILSLLYIITYIRSRIPTEFLHDEIRPCLTKAANSSSAPKMDFKKLEQALRQLPHDTLLTEIPQSQNSIAHLLRSNEAMKEHIREEGQDPDLATAIEENEELLQRYEASIDLTLRVIRERIGEAAAREVQSNVEAFRNEHPTKNTKAPSSTSAANEEQQEDGVYL